MKSTGCSFNNNKKKSFLALQLPAQADDGNSQSHKRPPIRDASDSRRESRIYLIGPFDNW